MYLIYIDADEKEIIANGMTPETFWETIKVNLEDNGFMQLKEDPHYFANWEEEQTLGHCWALQSAFANDLPECVRAMTEYTVYEVGRRMEPPAKEEDVKRFEHLRTFEVFSDNNVIFRRNANYLDNMLHEMDLIAKHGKRKKKPIDFRHTGE